MSENPSNSRTETLPLPDDLRDVFAPLIADVEQQLSDEDRRCLGVENFVTILKKRAGLFGTARGELLLSEEDAATLLTQNKLAKDEEEAKLLIDDIVSKLHKPMPEGSTVQSARPWMNYGIGKNGKEKRLGINRFSEGEKKT